MNDRLVVVGASLAGLRAAEAVRNDGWGGSVVLVGAEEHLPYDRPPLSKRYLCAEEPVNTTFREKNTLESQLDLTLILGTPADALDLRTRTVSVGRREIPYDELVIATGAAARTLPGTDDVGGVHTVRSVDDARALRCELRALAANDSHAGGRMVVVGAGFIGSEVAAIGRTLGLEVTILESQQTPLAHAVGTRIGAALTALHQSHGTTVLAQAAVAEIVAGGASGSGPGHVESVRLVDGTVLPAEVVVVGIGADPATGWLAGSGVPLADGIVTDHTLRAAPHVWAAGDVARWPNPLFDDVHEGTMRLQHWTSAAEQGARAARNAVNPGSAQAYQTVPYFWSDWYDSRIQFVGIAEAEHIEVVAGDEESCTFTALYRSRDRIVGAIAVDMPAEIMKYRRLIGDRASWDEAIDFSAKRRTTAAARAR